MTVPFLYCRLGSTKMSMVTIVFNSYLATYGCTVDMAGLEMELSGTFLLYSLLILMLEAQCDLHS